MSMKENKVNDRSTKKFFKIFLKVRVMINAP